MENCIGISYFIEATFRVRESVTVCIRARGHGFGVKGSNRLTLNNQRPISDRSTTRTSKQLSLQLRRMKGYLFCQNVCNDQAKPRKIHAYS